jgi:hypothetical protein
MKLQFKDLIDKHKGKPAIVVGHGPSLNTHIKKICELKNKFILFGCNEWYHIYQDAPHFWVIANNQQTIKTDINIINTRAKDSIICYADSVDLTDRAWIDKNLFCNYLPYDQRHFNSKPCGCKSCYQIIPGRLTIQEEFQKYTGSEKRYGSGDTVLLHSLSIAVLCGCDPIFITGLDLDYKKGYAKNKGNLISKVCVKELSHYSGRIVKDLGIINDCAKAIGRTIKVLNPGNSFGVFEVTDL